MMFLWLRRSSGHTPEATRQLPSSALTEYIVLFSFRPPTGQQPFTSADGGYGLRLRGISELEHA